MGQLRAVNITFDEDVRSHMLMSSLPASWSGMVTAVSSSNGTKPLVYDDVRSIILGDEQRRKKLLANSGGMLMMEGRGRQAGRSSKGSRSGRSKSRSGKNSGCWNCGGKGHFKKDCRAPKRKQNDDAKTANSANIAAEEEEIIQDALVLSCDQQPEIWVVDSGASFHATARREIIANYVAGDFGRVYLGDNEPCSIVGKGDVKIRLSNGRTWELKGVRHVPSLRKNLISVGQLASSGFLTTFDSTSWKVSRGAMVMASGKKQGTLYITDSHSDVIAVAGKEGDAGLWHNRLGHMSEKGMKALHSKGKLTGLTAVDLDFCEDCVYGKPKRVSFLKDGRELKTERLELVHTDVWGPSTVKSLGGSQYYVTFIDDATRKVWIYFLKHKSEVFETFKKWKVLVENEAGVKLKY